MIKIKTDLELTDCYVGVVLKKKRGRVLLIVCILTYLSALLRVCGSTRDSDEQRVWWIPFTFRPARICVIENRVGIREKRRNCNCFNRFQPLRTTWRNRSLRPNFAGTLLLSSNWYEIHSSFVFCFLWCCSVAVSFPSIAIFCSSIFSLSFLEMNYVGRALASAHFSLADVIPGELVSSHRCAKLIQQFIK